ncbi:flagellar biosynthesis protein FlhB [Escherichia coli]|uniref:Flagellar biosynthetic protein FlhB n=1 Tax=Escherichia coli TaxID=562 RepID=A0A484X3I3_ECOLX|nr:flagellar biosynthesis protein FlhB [Escherichia coli]
MSDESDDKTEAPTPHRLEKAREEGQIPRSRELTSLLILLVALVLSGLAVCRWPVDCRACSPQGCILITVLSMTRI